MRVDPSHSGATAPSTEPKGPRPSGLQGAFASLHATALAEGAKGAASGGGKATRALSSAQLFAEPTRVAQAARTRPGQRTEAADRTTVPRNERTRPVEGHEYSEIIAGPRNGMFLNQSGNERDGMAFLRVKRGDRTYHIYGSGEDRQVFAVGQKPKPVAPATTTPPATAPTGGSPAAPVANPAPATA